MLQYGRKLDSLTQEQQAGSKEPQSRSREQAVLLERKVGGNIDIAEVKACCLYALHGIMSAAMLLAVISSIDEEVKTSSSRAANQLLLS
ncbi:unnamed protein product [Cercopithifilaria johnstoni]|uniref:Uncharacterized protein n=1 Tax=Cercopithifilaria johnstoni TaxID=2874296 RepID=A0A8J2PQW9_9BILA|nr:unnamed protein product [Cercopithifilaria johnstoni]